MNLGSRTQRALSSLAIVLACLASVLFLGPRSAHATKYSGAFLEAGFGGGVGARAQAMGNAFVSIANDASAGYWNPAGMILVKHRETSAMHAERFGSLVNYDAFGYVQLVNGGTKKRSAFGFSVIRSGVDDIPFTSIDANTGEHIVTSIESWSEWAFLFSYARLIRPDLSLGGSVKAIRKSIADDSAIGFGFDFGALARPWRALSVGLLVQDVTSTILIWNGETETISPTAKFGISYPFAVDFLRGTFVAAADVDARFEGRKFAAQRWAGGVSGDFHYGAEYWYKDLLAIRGGSDEGSFTAGAGFRFPLGARGVGLDYAFLEDNGLDESHRVSALLKF
ncbi:MAG: PorV/PorQ family protein [bacterium]